MAGVKNDKVKSLLRKAEKCLILGEHPNAETISRQVIALEADNAEAY